MTLYMLKHISIVVNSCKKLRVPKNLLQKYFKFFFTFDFRNIFTDNNFFINVYKNCHILTDCFLRSVEYMLAAKLLQN